MKRLSILLVLIGVLFALPAAAFADVYMDHTKEAMRDVLRQTIKFGFLETTDLVVETDSKVDAKGYVIYTYGQNKLAGTFSIQKGETNAIKGVFVPVSAKGRFFLNGEKFSILMKMERVKNIATNQLDETFTTTIDFGNVVTDTRTNQIPLPKPQLIKAVLPKSPKLLIKPATKPIVIVPIVPILPISMTDGAIPMKPDLKSEAFAPTIPPQKTDIQLDLNKINTKPPVLKKPAQSVSTNSKNKGLFDTSFAKKELSNSWNNIKKAFD